MIVVHIKRVYEKPSTSDGRRILVDRLWPRGLSKEKARIDLWLKDIAPSAGLRKWFGHELAKWPEFQRRYQEELEVNESALAELCEVLRHEPVTLVFGAKDMEHNNAVVLKAYIER